MKCLHGLVEIHYNAKRRPVTIDTGDGSTKGYVVAFDHCPAWAKRLRLSSELLRIGREEEITKNIVTILVHPSFPVDVRHNAKIDREALAVWAEKRLR